MRYFIASIEVEHYDLTVTLKQLIKTEGFPHNKEIVETAFPNSEVEYNDSTEGWEVDGSISTNVTQVIEVTETEYELLEKYL